MQCVSVQTLFERELGQAQAEVAAANTAAAAAATSGKAERQIR